MASGARPRPVPNHVDEVPLSPPRQHELFIRGNASVFASPGLSAGAFLRSPYAVGREPDVQITVHPWDKYGRAWAAQSPAQFGGIASMEIANNHPRSRGRIALRSARFSDPPIFEGCAPRRTAPNEDRGCVRVNPHGLFGSVVRNSVRVLQAVPPQRQRLARAAVGGASDARYRQDAAARRDAYR